ncbi:MAG: TonB family protein [Paludibacter sp.]|nr:TonB family protein [Paludibacter sp.]
MNKANLYGLLGSTLSSIILFLILWFVVLPPIMATKPNDDDGLMVSFGDSYDGGGMGEKTAGIPIPTKSVEKAEQSKQVKQTVTASKPDNQSLITQQSNSEAIAEQNEKKRVRKEQQAIELQQIQTKKRIAEQNRKEQEAINNANAVNGLFGNNGSTKTGSGTGTGKGIGSGSGNGIQGNPAGNGTSGVGSSFRLGNRKYYGNPARPNYPKDIEGKITVNIRVDENGVVTGTSIGSPTTISDSEMRRDAISAANKTRFTKGTGIETGTITYNYKLE